MVALVERMLELNKRKHHVAAAFRPPDRGVRLKADATAAASAVGTPPLQNNDRRSQTAATARARGA
jgi:hypothetical protein